MYIYYYYYLNVIDGDVGICKYGPMISTMLKMWKESRNPVLKMKFNVECRMSWNLPYFGWINKKLLSTLKLKHYVD